MRKNNMPLVSIVMRNHNAYHLTSVALESLFDMTYSNFNIIVVNDGTTDNSGEELKTNFTDIILLESKKYIEYCKGLNLGINYALSNNAEYVFVVNNDTKDFSKNYLEDIVNAFNENKNIGLVGSLVYNYDGKELWNGNPKDKLGIPMETPTEGYVIKKDVFEKIGLLDEKLVRYFEDIDFIIRLRNAGFETLAIDTVSFSHLCNGTSSKQAFIPNYYRPRNLIWFMKFYCKNETLAWKLKKYVSYSLAHKSRVLVFVKKMELHKVIIAIVAFFYGTFIGLITQWKSQSK
jgi:GT2 family glycosyltransferase